MHNRVRLGLIRYTVGKGRVGQGTLWQGGGCVYVNKDVGRQTYTGRRAGAPSHTHKPAEEQRKTVLVFTECNTNPTLYTIYFRIFKHLLKREINTHTNYTHNKSHHWLKKTQLYLK